MLGHQMSKIFFSDMGNKPNTCVVSVPSVPSLEKFLTALFDVRQTRNDDTTTDAEQEDDDNDEVDCRSAQSQKRKRSNVKHFRQKKNHLDIETWKTNLVPANGKWIVHICPLWIEKCFTDSKDAKIFIFDIMHKMDDKLTPRSSPGDFFKLGLRQEFDGSFYCTLL